VWGGIRQVPNVRIPPLPRGEQHLVPCRALLLRDYLHPANAAPFPVQAFSAPRATRSKGTRKLFNAEE
jgi:hypothetical protein